MLDLRRRQFITLLGGAAAAWPLVARGQEPGRIYRLGCLFASPRDAPHYVALFDELRRLGFIEGQNLVVDAAGYGLPPERMEVHAADLMSGPVDVIVAAGDVAVRAAQRATTSIPILAFTEDMVGQGYVNSLSKPGGNITGVTILSSELDGKRQEILIEAVPGVRRIAALMDSNTTTPSQLRMLENGKRMELLHEMVPAAARVGVLGDPTFPLTESSVRDAETAARTMGLQVKVLSASTSREINAAFANFVRERPDVLYVGPSPFFISRRVQLTQLAARHAVPAIYSVRQYTEAGGLMSYGTSQTDAFRQMGVHTGRILKGAKPADLPVIQSTKFELIINGETARMLGLTVPDKLLAPADEVIE